MNKAGFILSGFVGIFWILILMITIIIQSGIPVLMRLTFLNPVASSFNHLYFLTNFRIIQIISLIDYSFIQVFSIFLIATSLISYFKFYKQ